MTHQGKQNKIIIYLPDDLLQKVDTKRGLVPMAAYVRDVLRKDIEKCDTTEV